MKCIISPVTNASVKIIETWEIRSIWNWLLIYLWVSKSDNEKYESDDFWEKFCHKIVHCKLFHSEKTQKIDSSILDFWWEILLISNFTIYGNPHKWTKIDFWDSARFDDAKKIYEIAIWKLTEKNIVVKTGDFWAMMSIKSENLWPINYIFEF